MINLRLTEDPKKVLQYWAQEKRTYVDAGKRQWKEETYYFLGNGEIPKKFSSLEKLAQEIEKQTRKGAIALNSVPEHIDSSAKKYENIEGILMKISDDSERPRQLNPEEFNALAKLRDITQSLTIAG